MNLQLLQTYADRVAEADHSGHAADHIARVVNNARALLQTVAGVDAAVVLAAATLHDTYDDKLVASVPAARAKTLATLQQAGATAAQAQAVLAIIDHMGFKANLAAHQSLSLEGQLVQDADRLDAIGAIGIARTFMYGGAHGSRMYDPALPPRTVMTASDYRHGESTVLNHFEEKLFKLEGLMNTEAGRRLAQRRAAVMHAFVAEFLAEWRGEA